MSLKHITMAKRTQYYNKTAYQFKFTVLFIVSQLLIPVVNKVNDLKDL